MYSFIQRFKQIGLLIVLMFVLFSNFVSDVQAQNVVIGTTTGTPNYLYGPIYRSSSTSTINYSRYAYLYTPSELGITTGSVITSLGWLKGNSGMITGNNTFKIYLKNTTSTTLTTSSWTTLSTGATNVYNNAAQQFLGLVDTYESYTLSTPFVYTGGSILILCDHIKTGTASGALNYYINTATTTALGAVNTTAFSDASNLISSTYGGYKPTIKISYTEPACTAPVAGTTISSSSVACSTSQITLSVSNSSGNGVGMNYQWQTSSNGVSWNDFTGATSQEFSMFQFSTTYYRRAMTCNAGTTVYSTPVLVEQNPFYNCYCTATATNALDEDILGVTLNGVERISTCAALPDNTTGVLNMYTNWRGQGPMTTLTASGAYPLTLNLGTCNGNYARGAAVFIDFTCDGDFNDANEMVYSVNAIPAATVNPTVNSGTVLVPNQIGGTAIGNNSTIITGMRVVYFETPATMTNTYACTTMTYGEVEDFLVTLANSSPCTSAPTNMTIVASTANACSNSAFDLSLTNIPASSGISYQWYAGGFPVSGATAVTYSPTQSQTTSYSCIVTCATNGSTANLTPVSIGMLPLYQCYCTPNVATVQDEEILSFTINNFTNETTCATVAPGANSAAGKYANYVVMPMPQSYPSITINQATSGSVVVGTCNVNNYSSGLAIFIDLNQDGDFVDAGEKVWNNGTLASISCAPASTVPFTFTIPTTALSGNTVMRIVSQETTAGSNIVPCPSYQWGEVEDYWVNLLPPASCFTANTTLAISASTTTICPGVTFDLTAGAPVGQEAYSYIWYANGQPVSGATASTLTLSQVGTSTYQVGAICPTIGDTLFSEIITVANSSSGCVCNSSALYAIDEDIFAVTIGNWVNTSDCIFPAGGSGSVLQRYANYAYPGTTVPSLSVAKNSTVVGTLAVGTCNSQNYFSGAAIFIDYNQDGDFLDDGESVWNNGTVANIACLPTSYNTFNFMVPSTATVGLTKMRIINAEGYPGNTITPCMDAYAFGETEDYYITITSSAVNCFATNTPTVVSAIGSAALCSGNGTGLSFVTPYADGTVTYQWMNNGQNIVGATSATYMATPSQTTPYSCLVTCLSTGLSQSSNSLTVTVAPVVTPSVVISNTTTTICSGGTFAATATPTNGGTTPTYQWKKNGQNISGATQSTYSTTTAANGDVFTCVLTSSANCASPTNATSNGITVTVSTSVTPSVAISSTTTTICSGGTFAATATPTNGGTTPAYQWKKNGQNITGATQSTYSTTTAVNGDVFTCQLIANNACQTTEVALSNAITVSVTTPVTPSVSITSSTTTLCSGTSVTFTAAPTNGGSQPTYQWKKNGQNISGATSLSYITATIVNGDVFTCQMTSNNSCQTSSTSLSNSITMTVSGLVSFYQDLDGDAYGNPQVSTTGCIAPAGYVSDNTDCNDNQSAVHPNATETCNSIDDNCNGTVDEGLSVTPSVVISSTTTTICSGGTFAATATPTNGGTTPTYQWKKNEQNITGATQSTYSTTTAANGDVFTCVLTSSANCASPTNATSNGITVTVSTSVTPSVAISSTTTTICSGGTFAATATPTNGGTTPAYQWKKNGQNITGATQSTYSTTTAVNGDVFTCQLIANNACQTTEVALSNAITVVVNTTVVPLISLTSTTTELCGDSPVQFTAIVSNGGDSPAIFWMRNGQQVNGVSGNTYTPSNVVDGDQFSVVLIANNLCQSASGDTSNVIAMTVAPSVTYYQDNDGDGVGNSNVSLVSCQAVNGYVTVSGDCNDLDGSISPSAPELCNSIDDNCNGLIDDGLSAGDIVYTNVNTALYPTCSTGNLFAANLNTGIDTDIIPTVGPDLWYKLVANYNSLRVGLSAATGDNSVYIYQSSGNCMALIAQEHEVTTGNQTLFTDDLVIGNTYYIAVHRNSGTSNTSAKVCLNHFVGSTCDHVYSSNTGVYANVCSSFKAQFKANAASYVFNVNSATQGGVPMAGFIPSVYTTPTSSSIVTRLGSIVPVNMSGTAIQYGISIDVNYNLADAAGNMNLITAMGTSTACSLTLNSETGIQLRTTDRCPVLKPVASYIAPDRTICGALRYEWEFTQTLPVAAAPVTAMSPINSTQMFLTTVPGMGNGKTYNVRVRPIHTSGATGEWGATQCLKTAASGMIQTEQEGWSNLSSSSGFSVYPNPTSGSAVTLNWSEVQEGWTSVVVRNSIGEIVAQDHQWVYGSKAELNLNHKLADGIYLISVEINGTTETVRWIIQK